MAEELELVKISELPDASNVTATDVVPVVQNGTTKKASLPVIRDYVVGELGSAAQASTTDFEPAGAIAEVENQLAESASQQNERIDRLEYSIYLIQKNGVFKAYRTKSQMLADVANIPINSVVSVVNDPANNAETNDINGEYHYNGTNFFKLPNNLLDQLNIKTAAVETNAKNYVDSNALFNPKSLENNFDLKSSFLKVGFYFASGSIAATLLNCPTTTSFALEVLKHYLDDYLIYRITDRSGKIFQCIAVPTAQGGFGAWIEITSSQYNQAKNYVDNNPLFKPVLLTNNQDLNTLINIGYYYCSGSVAATLINCPSTTALSIENIKTNDTWFIQRLIDRDLKIWIRSYTGGGNFSIWLDITTKQYNDAVAYIDDKLSKLTQKKPLSIYKSGFKLYTTTVTNTTKQTLTNTIIELKIEFNIGEVYSDAQIVVIDDDGNEFAAQFAPDFYFNLRQDLDQGFYKDGSFWSGALCILDNLAVDQTKHYKVYVYNDEVKPITETYTVLNNGGRDTYSAFGYTLNFNLAGQTSNSSILRNIGLSDGTVFPVANVPRCSILLNGASVATTTFFNVNQSVKFSKIGSLFIDIVAEVGNAAQDSLTADSLRYKAIYRLFKNGKLKILSRFIAKKDIAVNVLYACTNGLMTSGHTSGSVASSSYKHCRFGLNNHTFDTVALFYFGDVHRDSSSWGATRPNVGSQTVSATSADLRYGWSDTVGSASALKFPIKKNWAWASEINILIDNQITTSSTLLAILNNTPIGFIATRVKPFRYSKRKLFKRIEDLAIGWQEWWHSSDSVGFGDNANPSVTNIRFGRLIEFYKVLKNESDKSFEELYSTYIQSIKSLYGITDLSKIGDKYNSSTNPLKVEYLPHYFQPFLQAFYLQAVKNNDTAKIAEIKSMTLSIATALKTYADANGSVVSNAATNTGVGPWNMNAIALRSLAQAIWMGLDTNNGFLNTFNSLEADFTNSVRYGKILNQPSDTRDDIPAERRYFQYYCFGIQAYIMSCLILNRQPVFNVAAMPLNAINANGDVKEMEWTCSESRRGRREQHLRMIFPLIFNRLDGEINAAHKVLDAAERWLFDSTGYPYQIGEFLSREDISSTEKIRLDADTSWSLTVLGDLLLSNYFNYL